MDRCDDHLEDVLTTLFEDRSQFRAAFGTYFRCLRSKTGCVHSSSRDDNYDGGVRRGSGHWRLLLLTSAVSSGLAGRSLRACCPSTMACSCGRRRRGPARALQGARPSRNESVEGNMADRDRIAASRTFLHSPASAFHPFSLGLGPEYTLRFIRSESSKGNSMVT